MATPLHPPRTVFMRFLMSGMISVLRRHADTVVFLSHLLPLW